MSKITVVEAGVNGHSWWRIYSDGWIEQGGRVGASIDVQRKHGAWASDIVTVTFPKAFRDTNYSLSRATVSGLSDFRWDSPGNNGENIGNTVSGASRTRTSMRLWLWDTNGSNVDEHTYHYAYWAACGWGA